VLAGGRGVRRQAEVRGEIFSCM